MKGVERKGRKFRVKVTRPDGSREYVSFDTELEASNYYRTVSSPAAKMYRDFMANPRYIPPPKAEVRVPSVVEYGREVFAARDLKRNTEDSYENALRRIAKEPLGGMAVNAVRPRDIRSFFSTVKKNRSNIFAVLSMVFTAAKREGYYTVSPMDAAQVKMPKVRQKDIQPFTAAEIQVAAEAALDRATDKIAGARDGLCILLGGFAGLRAGEVGGLRVQDVDFKRCRLTISRNAQRYTKREGERSSVMMETPKSQRSERVVPVDCDLTEELRQYIADHAPLADGTVFYTAQSNAVTDQTVTRALTLATKAAGLRRATFHDLRHSFATNLAIGGLAMPVLQKVMGWSSIRMTDRYAHIQAEDVDKAAAITARQRGGAA